MRIKILEKGWEGFSDWMGPVQFRNGVSVGDVAEHDLFNISSSIKVVAMTDDGSEGARLGLAQVAVTNREFHAPQDRQLERGAVPGTAGETPRTRGTMGILPKFHTEDELGEVADQKGISGLREIATQWGVKGRAIHELMRAILRAQKEALAKAKLTEQGRA